MLKQLFILTLVAAGIGGCASAGAKKASPTEYGFGLHATPGLQIGDGNTSVHAALSYTRLGFDGGHDNMYQFGAQVRRYFPKEGVRGPWVGGEAAIVRFKSVYDSDFFSDVPSNGGFSIGAMAGYRFPTSYVPVSVYAGLGIVRFGDFKADNIVIAEAGTGILAKVGVCFHVFSLLHDKGM